jgi:hypothetical protein
LVKGVILVQTKGMLRVSGKGELICHAVVKRRKRVKKAGNRK